MVTDTAGGPSPEAAVWVVFVVGEFEFAVELTPPRGVVAEAPRTPVRLCSCCCRDEAMREVSAMMSAYQAREGGVYIYIYMIYIKQQSICSCCCRAEAMREVSAMMSA